MNTKMYIEKLTEIGGVSSNETEIARFLSKELSRVCDRIETDISGNVYGFINNGKRNAKTIMLEAHMDRIGLIVSRICKDGTVLFSEAGGIDERILPYSEVEFLNEGERIKGIILPGKNDSEEKANYSGLHIFTGMEYDELKTKIKIGSKILINSIFISLLGNEICSSALDNRAGIASIMKVLNDIDKYKLKYNIEILFSVGEELGLHGAFTGAAKSSADAAFIVDVTHGMTSDTKDETGVFPLGSGAIICRGPNLHYRYTKKLIALAKKDSIPYRIEVAPQSSGTTAWALQVSGGGIPSMLISIPLKYMHTNVEVINIKDVETTAELIIKALEGGMDID